MSMSLVARNGRVSRGGVIAVPLFKKLGMGAVLGYLIAGVLIGPWLFGFHQRC